MKRPTAKWVRKAEEDWEGAQELAARPSSLRDLVCFHCQQSAEKYFKAQLQEKGAAIPKIHDLEELLDLLLPHDASLAPLRRGLASLSRYAVDYRYPGERATTRHMKAALRHAERVRREIRERLGLEL
ncbi:MAG: HEPN domain-containing protein [Gemmataceae bacterium]|nr:HEPN domain-containing protein [Gemmataceae bacterium]MCI0742706.1 HEPN domain-containing protein [Gemmataceae bacterium]